MPHPNVLAIEKRVALAHKVLWEARDLADAAGLDGLESDLWMTCVELQRMQEDLLRGTRRLRKARNDRAYLSESAPDDRSPAA